MAHVSGDDAKPMQGQNLNAIDIKRPVMLDRLYCTCRGTCRRHARCPRGLSKRGPGKPLFSSAGRYPTNFFSRLRRVIEKFVVPGSRSAGNQCACPLMNVTFGTAKVVSWRRIAQHGIDDACQAVSVGKLDTGRSGLQAMDLAADAAPSGMAKSYPWKTSWVVGLSRARSAIRSS